MANNNTRVEQGFLVLADISGYEAYIAGTEIEHAQEIIADLLEFLIHRLRPAFTLVQVEADAIFAYMSEKRMLRGETLVELIENTYVAFKDQLTSIKRHHTCTCAACQNVNSLDLKFFIHYGEYIEHSIDDHHGLLGFAPMFVRRREWKKPVTLTTGWQGYALFTEDSLARLDMQPEDLNAVEFKEARIKLIGLNLQAHYTDLLENRRIIVMPEIADASLRAELDAPPPVVWEWLNDPQNRNLWWESFIRWSKRLRPGGRTGPGAVNHCNHGVGGMLETVLDWRPFDYYTAELHITPGRFDVLQTTYLEALPDGRTGVKICYQLQNRHTRWLARPFCGLVAGFLGFELKRLKRLLAN